MAMLNNQMVYYLFVHGQTMSFTTSLGTCTSKPSMSHSLRQAVATVKPKAVASRAPMERQNKLLRWCEGARFTKKWKIMGNTLWLFNIAMENGPFIDGLPIENGDFPWLC
jgi:hypothetical protein